jgi:putative hydrolase of the HAD superfamily
MIDTKLEYHDKSILIFDLGGVILNLDLEGAFKKFSEVMSGEIHGLKHAYEAYPFIRQYEVGRIETTDFQDQFIQILEDGITRAAFTELWNSMLVNIPAERIEWILRLKDAYQVVLLSNTNAMHIDRVGEIMKRDTDHPDLESIFEKTYYSYEIGLRKPDAECYQYVLDDLGAVPENCVLFDDSPQNLESSESMGIQGVLIEQNHLIMNNLPNGQ